MHLIHIDRRCHGSTACARNGVMSRILWAYKENLVFFLLRARTCFCGFTVLFSCVILIFWFQSLDPECYRGKCHPEA